MDNQCRQYVSNHKNHQPNTCSAEEFNVHLRLMGDKDCIGLDMFSAIQMNMLKDSHRFKKDHHHCPDLPRSYNNFKTSQRNKQKHLTSLKKTVFAAQICPADGVVYAYFIVLLSSFIYSVFPL